MMSGKHGQRPAQPEPHHSSPGAIVCMVPMVDPSRGCTMPAAGSVPHSGGLSPARLRRVLDHIELHLDESLSLRQLAVLARLSPNHFAAQFRLNTGLPPHRYVMQRRITRAKELVVDGRLPLVEISCSLGFPSQAHFTTTFRKLVGATPGAYRSGLDQKSQNLPLKCERPEWAAAEQGGQQRPQPAAQLVRRTTVYT